MSVITLFLACWLLLLILALAMLRATGRAERVSEARRRKRRAHTAAMMVAVAPVSAAFLDAGASTARAAACAGGPARVTICLINVERKRRGLAPVRANTRLIRAAHRHSLDMVHRGYFGHTSLSGRTFIDRLRIVGYVGRGCTWSAGETIAWGAGASGTPASRVAGWMRSASHRPILLGASFREVGVGIAPGTPGAAGAAGAGATYTADFGRRRC